MAARFPRAPVNDVKAEDAMMKRVDIHHGEIGSRPSGMPKGLDNDQMSIEHTADQNRQK